MQNPIFIQMSKSIKILAFYVLLIVFVQSLSPLEPSKNAFNLRQIQFKSNELKEEIETINIIVKPEDNLNILVGYGGLLILKARHNESQTYLFDPETIEKDTSFETDYSDMEMYVSNLKCRLWMKSETIYLFCDSYFNNGYNTISINSKTFEYKSKYQINVNFTDEITFEQSDIEIPFIYSNEQTININESQLIYELRFKIQTYNDESLYIYGSGYNYAILEDYLENSQEPIC